MKMAKKMNKGGMVEDLGSPKEVSLTPLVVSPQCVVWVQQLKAANFKEYFK